MATTSVLAGTPPSSSATGSHGSDGHLRSTAENERLRIGEVAARCGVNPKTIRYYEQIGLLPEPERLSSGYRVYGRNDVERLAFIRSAQRFGLALDEIREVLAFRDRGEAPCGYVREVVRREAARLDERIAELLEMREELGRLLARTDDGSGDAGYCHLLEHDQFDPVRRDT
jgi:DNA-binding transcriptional MerR regulator